MRRLLLALAAIVLMALPVYAQEARSNIIIKTFRNVSGSTLTSGTGVVLDLTDTDNTTGSYPTEAGVDLGYLIDTTTIADDRLFVGVVHSDSCADDALCQVVVEGPTIVRWAGSTDNTNVIGSNGTVGTTTVAGNLGSGANAGMLMSLQVQGTSPSLDNTLRWVWVTGLLSDTD